MSEHSEQANACVDAIAELVSYVPQASAMLAALQFDLFTALEESPKALQEVCGAIRVADASRLQLLLDCLVAAKLVQCRHGRYANTAVASTCLVRGHAHYLGALADNLAFQWTNMLKTAESIRTGQPQGKIDWSQTSVGLEAFFRGLHPNALLRAHDLLQASSVVDIFRGAKTVVDIGGGTGAFAMELVRAFPQLQVTIWELPGAVPVARSFIEAEHLSERISVESRNILECNVEDRFDCALLSAVIQVLDAERAGLAICKAALAVHDGGKIVIAGHVLDDDRTGPMMVVGLNLYLANVLDFGQAYTEREHRAWLDEAGCIDAQRLVTGRFDGGGAMIATKARR
jgi:hypothetical protein